MLKVIGFGLVNLLVLVCFASAQSSGEPKVATTVGPRPVEDVILQWEKLYGWNIAYEDPRFEYADDLEDVTVKVRKDLVPGEPIDPNKRIIGARERQLSVTYFKPTGVDDAAAELEASKRLVDAFAKISGNTFLVSRSDGRVHIVPDQIRDESGHLQHNEPMMNTLISVPPQPRTGGELLSAICDALSSGTGHSVGVGTIPGNAMVQFHTEAGYENRTAQEVLDDFLNKMPNGTHYSWALLFQKDYALNIHMVPQLSTSMPPPAAIKQARTRPKGSVRTIPPPPKAQ